MSAGTDVIRSDRSWDLALVSTFDDFEGLDAYRTHRPGTLDEDPMNTIQRTAVLTSGGDAPGMNAAIRATVRTRLAQGWEVLGVRNGYAGLLDGQVDVLTSRNVAGILHLGGTVLGSARCPEFATQDGQRQERAHLQDRGVDAVVVIGATDHRAGPRHGVVMA